jgi:hypothetical protein
MCVRFYGLDAVLAANNKHPFVSSANKILLQLHSTYPEEIEPVLSLSILSPADSHGSSNVQKANRKNVYKLLGTLKAVQRKEHHQTSFDYIAAKVQNTPVEAVTNVISSGLLEILKQTSSKTLGKIDRLYLLRWFTGEEADWNLQLRFQAIIKSQT